MARKKIKKKTSKKTNPLVPENLRQRLETARLETLTLFRALDRVNLTASEIPQGLLRELFELDADFAEALWALDQPPHSLNFRAMIRDTLDSLERWPEDCEEFLDELPPHILQPLANHRELIFPTLTTLDAYSQVPGRDPNAPDPQIG
jgi:hypothetical protein